MLCQDSVIPSPVNGVVAQKLVSAGELVAAGQKLILPADVPVAEEMKDLVEK